MKRLWIKLTVFYIYFVESYRCLFNSGVWYNKECQSHAAALEVQITHLKTFFTWRVVQNCKPERSETLCPWKFSEVSQAKQQLSWSSVGRSPASCGSQDLRHSEIPSSQESNDCMNLSDAVNQYKRIPLQSNFN